MPLAVTQEDFLVLLQETSKGKSLVDSAAPPASPDVLSFSQQNHVTTLLQFIVCLGVCPNLRPGVGIPLVKRSGFAQLIKGWFLVEY